MSGENRKSILFLLAGDRNKASSRVRGYWVAEELERKGFPCKLRSERGRLALLMSVGSVISHEVIIFQKTYSRYHKWLMALANMMGKLTYLDIDDAPSMVNSAVTLGNFAAMCRMADGVFAGSTNLLGYTRQFQRKSYLIPTCVKLENYRYSTDSPMNNPDEICLGWVGNGKYYARDLIEILREPLTELATLYQLRFKIVGACGVEELYDTFQGIPNLETEFVDSIPWSETLAVSEAIQDFDIGLYPLLPTEFNEFKCGFKALEYMAMGIPVVASPVANNADVIDDGKTGVLASTKDEWVSGVRDLIEDPKRRRRWGISGRERVVNDYSISAVADLISEILCQNSSSIAED